MMSLEDYLHMGCLLLIGLVTLLILMAPCIIAAAALYMAVAK